ncbi:TetR/AcrR family transcriptional regulator [Pseudomaricurvus sp.]|uniref:TetR/AcrR family transcriptional regulator n=1 Tax=Pseudomaricurvus sp. TaxID=2004510 RepID=UPI003F6C1C58
MTTSLKTDNRSARNQILDAAESLYAERGLGAVSLRQISSAAGARNTNAVQYYFDSAEGLIRAILERRAEGLELQRAELLAEYSGKGSLQPHELLAVFYLPLLRDGDEKVPKFAEFFLVLMASPGGWQPIIDVFLDRPITRKVMEMVAEANRPVPVAITWQRVLYGGVAMLTYIVNTTRINASPECYKAVVQDALNMGAAALEAPVGDNADVLAKSFEDFFESQGVLTDSLSQEFKNRG